MFDGVAYIDKFRDVPKNNLQRVLMLLLDGRYHGRVELERVGGVGCTSRIRDLRTKAYGGFNIHKIKKGSQVSYGLSLTFVTLEKVNAVMRGLVPMSVSKELPLRIQLINAEMPISKLETELLILRRHPKVARKPMVHSPIESR